MSDSNGTEALVASRTRRVVRDWWPVLAQLLGVVVVAVGFGVLAVWAGLAVGGAGLITVGTVAEIVEGH